MITFLFGAVMFLLGTFAGMVLFALAKSLPTAAEDHFDWDLGNLKVVKDDE